VSTYGADIKTILFLQQAAERRIEDIVAKASRVGIAHQKGVKTIDD